MWWSVVSSSSFYTFTPLYVRRALSAHDVSVQQITSIIEVFKKSFEPDLKQTWNWTLHAWIKRKDPVYMDQSITTIDIQKVVEQNRPINTGSCMVPKQLRSSCNLKREAERLHDHRPHVTSWSMRTSLFKCNWSVFAFYECFSFHKQK